MSIMDKASSKIFSEQYLLAPETETERSFLEDQQFIEGLHWGVPRFGHPEGKVLFHIKEVLSNIDRCDISEDDRRKLRLIAFVHDTFKFQESKKVGQARDWSKHHAALAGNYIKNITTEEDIITITALHDEAFYAWKLATLDQNIEASDNRFNKLIDKTKGFLQLYYTFFVCDTTTGDKNLSPIGWFEQKVPSLKRITLK